MTTKLLLISLTLMRLIIGLMFFVSIVSKLPHLGEFEETINSFNILPKKFQKIAILLILSGDISILTMLIFGGSCLIVGFTLAIIVLITFTIVLSSVIQRKLSVRCNCFGKNKNLISHATLWRNAAFIICATIGLFLSIDIPQESLKFSETTILVGVAAILVFILTNVEDLAYLFE
jgi:Methylamine utilisation protein MauE